MARLSNILIDFLNRDNREIFGLFENASEELHIALLTEALNVVVFLCDEFCITPPGPVAECSIAQKALLRRKDFLTERLIRFPLRESSLGDFFEKKEREYSKHKHIYHGLFSNDSRRLLTSFPQALILRSTRVGEFIAERWEAGPDQDAVWSKVLQYIPAKEVEFIRTVGKHLVSQEAAFNWPQVQDFLTPHVGSVPEDLRVILQHYYFVAYLEEYNLRTITSLPFSRVNFDLPAPDLCYDYGALKEALRSCRAWHVIANMSANSILRLRNREGYFAFREAFDHVASISLSTRDVGRRVARVVHEGTAVMRRTRIVNDLAYHVIPPYGLESSETDLDALEERLFIIGNTLKDKEPEFTDSTSVPAGTDDQFAGVTIISSRDGEPEMNSKVGIFIALEMERQFLIDRWALSHSYGEIAWIGRVGEIEVFVYGPDQIGRVPAAVATMAFLGSVKPTLIIVTGIAGGFAESGSELGDVIVPDVVADLATRKIRDESDGIKSEFRPSPFNIDTRIRDFLKSGSFDPDQWERDVLKEANWPPGRRPSIRYGPIASIDEVVSSDEWQKKLIDYWPGLLGIEMEAGGVCRAAQHHRVDVGVVRGISDLANPMKSDDQWRRISLHTAVRLLESAFHSSEFASSLIA